MSGPSDPFYGKVVLLTGAGGGLGEELARQLVRRGADLLLSSRRPERLQRAADSARAAGGPGRVLGGLAADLSDDAGCARLYAECAALAPRVDMLINNAGVAMYGPLHRLPQAEWERLVQINLLAPLRLTARFLPDMAARRSGHIVLMASIFGLAGIAGVGPYAATKFGLRGLGETLGEDMRGQGVAVSVVYPFFTRTDMLDAPQYGGRTAVPAWLPDAPAPVVARTLDGLARRRRHIYPSARAAAYALAARLAPWALPPIARMIGG